MESHNFGENLYSMIITIAGAIQPIGMIEHEQIVACILYDENQLIVMRIFIGDY